MMHWFWIIPALPLLGSLLLGLFGRRIGAAASAFIGAGSVGVAAVLSIILAIRFLRVPPPGDAWSEILWRWISIGSFHVDVGLNLDPLSLLMILVVTIVGFLIHVFSTEYMEGEEGYSRYFAYLNLFVAAMLLLVMGSSLLTLFVGWEGVGLCSYLLVGFWFRNPANGYAARKSFIVTRVADVAMMIGLFVVFLHLGTLDIQAAMARAVAVWRPGSFWPAAAASLLLIGGLGKSAQLPLHTWLPDAMAGPTPVSALIHAATMVTAGVYLVARTHVLFMLAPQVMTAIAVGGTLTLLVAAFAAMVQSDIKRILAYSTMSQIGYMFLALGVGAWPAAMFHFLTHAVFKALLFLAAGAVTMRTHHEQNIFRLGGLWRKIPVAFVSFLIGSASLAALPLLTAGFYSKEMILMHVWPNPLDGHLLWAAGILGAFFTAIYIFRAVFVMFFGEQHTGVSGDYGIRIITPLVVLSLGTITVGWLEVPSFLGGVGILTSFLSSVFGSARALPVPVLPVAWIGFFVPVCGLIFAWFRFGRVDNHEQVTPSAVRAFLLSGFGFDRLYNAVVVRPFLWLVWTNRNDVIDRVFQGIALGTVELHILFRRTQTGQIRRYASWLAAGSLAIIVIVVFS